MSCVEDRGVLRAHRLLVIPSLALPLAVASCSLLVDTAGLVGEPAGGSAESGGGDGGDGAGDGGGGGEAGTADGPGSSDACSDPAIVLCERFDTPQALGRYPSTTDPSTSVASDPDAFLSAPRSAKFTIEPSNNGSPDATIQLTTSVTVPRFVLEASVFIERGEPGGDARLLSVKAGTGGSLRLTRSGTLTESSDLRAQLVALPFGQWLRVRLEMRTDAPRTMTLTVGEATSGQLPLLTTGAAGPVVVDLGVSDASSPTQGWVVRWDDVSIKRL